jgi:FtsZ-interacting cell division protein ZipA
VSTAAIIVIVVVVLALLVLLAVVLPRMRARKAEAQRARELERRRDQEVQRHRGEAEVRGLRADEAEQRAKIAAKEAEVERAQAEAHQARASLHERGLADDELMGERDATRDSTRIDDRPGESDPGRFDRTDDDAEGRGSIASSTPTGEYERGRRDEARDEGR